MEPFGHYRAAFRGREREDLRGFPFCDGPSADGGPPPPPHGERAMQRLRPRWEADSVGAPSAGGASSGTASPGYTLLIESGLAASSQDDESQSVLQVLRNDRGFWSSTGSASPGATEWLMFSLRSPMAVVRYIRLAVYRALYQAGHPVYPPREIQVLLGPSPERLQPASPWMHVLPSDALQTFPVFADAPPARYMMLLLRGKMQLQREDNRWYTAIRYVAAVGRVLPARTLVGRPPATIVGRLTGDIAAGDTGDAGDAGMEGVLITRPLRAVKAAARVSNAESEDAAAAAKAARRTERRGRAAALAAEARAAAEARHNARLMGRPATMAFHESLEEMEEQTTSSSDGEGDGRCAVYAGDDEGVTSDASSSGGEEAEEAAAFLWEGRGGGDPSHPVVASGSGGGAVVAAGNNGGGNMLRGCHAARARPDEVLRMLLARRGGDEDPHDVEALLGEILQDPPLGLDPEVLLGQAQHAQHGAQHGQHGQQQQQQEEEEEEEDSGDGEGSGSEEEGQGGLHSSSSSSSSSSSRGG